MQQTLILCFIQLLRDAGCRCCWAHQLLAAAAAAVEADSEYFQTWWRCLLLALWATSRQLWRVLSVI